MDTAKMSMSVQEPQLLDKMENVAYRLNLQAGERTKHMSSRYLPCLQDAFLSPGTYTNGRYPSNGKGQEGGVSQAKVCAQTQVECLRMSQAMAPVLTFDLNPVQQPKAQHSQLACSDCVPCSNSAAMSNCMLNGQVW